MLKDLIAIREQCLDNGNRKYLHIEIQKSNICWYISRVKVIYYSYRSNLYHKKRNGTHKGNKPNRDFILIIMQ